MRVFVDASVLIAAMLSPAGGSSLVFGYIKAKKNKEIKNRDRTVCGKQRFGG